MRPPKRILIPFFILAALAIFSFAVMWLWNAILSPVLEINTITFWQALGIFVLSKILFGFKPFGGPPRKFRSRHSKWRNMSNEEREHFKEVWKRRCEDQKQSGEKN